MHSLAFLEARSDVEDGAVPAVLNQLSAGVVLLDPQLKVQFANNAFRAMARDRALVLRGQSLSSDSPSDAAKLDHLTRSVLAGAPGGTMAIRHREDGRLITILVNPVHSRGAFTNLKFRDSAAILFMFDPVRPLALPPEWVMDAYQLTMAEAQVALQASTGRSVAEIGIRLNIKPNTVKSHLRRIFPKTGVRGQAELVRLIAALGSVRCEANPDARAPFVPNDRRATNIRAQKSV